MKINWTYNNNNNNRRKYIHYIKIPTIDFIGHQVIIRKEMGDYSREMSDRSRRGRGGGWKE